MGKKRRNKIRQQRQAEKAEKALLVSDPTPREQWIAMYCKEENKTCFIAHRGPEFICELPMLNFSFERNVTPYRELGNYDTRHFSTGMASCSGSLSWGNISFETRDSLVKDPFDITMAQNGVLTATVQGAMIHSWNMEEANFEATSMKFEPIEKKKDYKEKVPMYNVPILESRQQANNLSPWVFNEGDNYYDD